MYLTISRLDIAHAVRVVICQCRSLCCRASDSSLSAWDYDSLSLILCLICLVASCGDADWAGDPTDRRSTTGFCVFLVSYIMEKQEAGDCLSLQY